MSRVRAALNRWPLRNVRRRPADPPAKWMYLGFGIFEIAWGIYTATLDFTLGQLLVALSIIAFGGMYLFFPRLARGQYYRGWFARDSAMWGSLEEAQHRGLDVSHWAAGERERAIATMIEWNAGG